MINSQLLASLTLYYGRDVTTEATDATVVTPKFSDTLTLSQPREADSAHYRRGRSYHFNVITSLYGMISCFRACFSVLEHPFLF